MRTKLILCCIFWFIGASMAQEATEEATETLRLRPFTLAFGDVSGAAPALWDELQAGAYIRDDGDIDNTYIIHASAEAVPAAELVDPFLAAYEIDSLPESTETYASSLLTWDIYSFEYNPPDFNLLVDLAVAELENRVYLVILQSYPEENLQLRDQAFFPALDNFGLPLAEIYESLGYEALSPLELSSFNTISAYPTAWEAVNEGSYMRRETAEDLTTLIIQSSPDLEAPAFAQLLLETLQLPTELPENPESFETSVFDWTIYQLDFSRDIELSLLIALAEDEQRSYMVVLLTLAEEAESLRETVLLPVLDSTKSLN